MPPETLRLEIAGIGLDLNCPDRVFLKQVTDRYPGFLRNGHTDPSCGRGPEYRLELETGPELLPGDEAAPRITRAGGVVRLRRRDFHLEMAPESGEVRGVVAGNVYSLDSLLRVLFSVALLEVEGLLLHASAVVARDGRAHVFFGKSGAGKSTAVRLSQPRLSLSDELVIVRRCRDGYYAYGTPFWGNLESHGENRRAPLGRLLCLKQDTEVHLEALPYPQAFRRLLGCVLFFARQEPWVSQAVDLTARLAREAPVQTLCFRKDDTFWRLLEDD